MNTFIHIKMSSMLIWIAKERRHRLFYAGKIVWNRRHVILYVVQKIIQVSKQSRTNLIKTPVSTRVAPRLKIELGSLLLAYKIHAQLGLFDTKL